MVDEVPVEEVDTSILEEFPVTSFPVPRSRGTSPIPVSHRLPAPASAAPRIPAWAKIGLGRLNPWANFMQLYLQGLGQLPPSFRETPARSGSQLPVNVAQGIQALKKNISVPPGGIAQLPGSHRVYHGTVSQETGFPLTSKKMDLEHRKEYVTKRSSDEQLNRLLGPHFSKTPHIANKFAEGLYQWGSVAKGAAQEGVYPGRVVPADISTRLKKIHQPSHPYSGMSGEKVWQLPVGDSEAISNDMFNVVFSDSRNKKLFLDIAEKQSGKPRHVNSQVYDSIIAGTLGRSPETTWGFMENIDPDAPQLMGRFVRNLLGTDLLHANSSQRQSVVDQYKRILGEQGYVGIEYENTAPKEIMGLGKKGEARRSFVVFDPFTGARSPFALKGKNWSKGGFIDKSLYQEKRML